MKTVPFRPLRRIKKTGKIVVAAYPQWRKLLSADCAAFGLVIEREYAGLPEHEHVYNHAGQPLFWRDFDPARIPVFEYNVLFDLDAIRASHQNYAIRWSPEGPLNYCCTRLHLDGDGVPPFSHYTIDYVAEHQPDISQYEPLTVGTVVKWFGWLLYRLDNVRF